MTAPTREQIIHRAYELWERAGKPDGRDEEFYHQAEKELNEAIEWLPGSACGRTAGCSPPAKRAFSMWIRASAHEKKSYPDP
jgi:hypothetical protein